MNKLLYVGMGAAVFAVLCQVTQAQPKTAANSAEVFQVYGEGQISCGTYLEVRTWKNAARDDVFATWVHGYVSGRNQTAKQQPSRPFPTVDVLAYLDKYCRDNPLKHIVNGAQKLYEETGGAS